MKKLHTPTIKIALLACFCLVISFGFKAKSGEDMLGEIKNDRYTNKYFGFSLSVPPSWSIQDNEANEKIMKKGRENIANGDEDLEEAMEASQLDVLNLLTMFEQPVGTNVDSYNPSFACVAEKISNAPQIKTGKDYLSSTKKLLQNSNMPYEFSKEIYSKKISNKGIDVMEASVKYDDLVIKQKFYATIIKGYAIGFVISYTSEEEHAKLDKIVNSFKFN